MQKIDWVEKLSVGIDDLDEQHKSLIDLFNKLVDYSKDRSDVEAISNALTMMTEYAEKHFQFEEALMKKYFYPEIEGHTKEHNKFREKTVQYCFGVMNYDSTVLAEMMTFLQSWIVHHVSESDMKYRQYYIKRGIIKLPR